MYYSDHQFPRQFRHDFETEFMVVEGDCLEAAIWLKHAKNVNPVVLNMASSSHPGGGYRIGAGAQEGEE